MNRTFYLIIIILVNFGCSNTLTSPDIFKSIKTLEETDKDLTIDSIINIQKDDLHFKKLENKVIYKLGEKKTIWLYIYNVNLNETKYFSIWSPYTEYSKIYLHKNDSIIELNEISEINYDSYNSEYRFPSWKLPKLGSNVDIYLKIKDTKRATGLKILLQSETDFLKFSKLDYFKIGLISILLFSLLIIVLSLFITKKQFSLIWYGAYIFVSIIEFYVSQGIDHELHLFSLPIINSTKKLFLQSLLGAFLGLFFVNFYTFNKRTRGIKILFKALFYLYLLAFLVVSSFIILNKVYIPKIYIWLPLRIFIIIILFAHIILIRKQKLPYYLGFSFLLPILGYLSFAYINNPQNASLFSYFIRENTFHIAILFEISIMIFFIISQLVKGERLSIRLSKENLNLRNSFQENILDIQEKEKDRLLSNVHDSFGGYLEALKLRLLQKNNSTEKIKEILDSFYKEYRYLLNNLYSPKINSKNLIDNITEFIEKFKTLSGKNISYEFSIKEIPLSQKQCIHIYRIISELLTNALKHSNATNVNISIKTNNRIYILIEVIDDGIGFNTNKIHKDSYGLKSIKNRVKILEGDFDIKSIKNIETKVFIKFPIQNKI